MPKNLKYVKGLLMEGAQTICCPIRNLWVYPVLIERLLSVYDFAFCLGLVRCGHQTFFFVFNFKCMGQSIKLRRQKRVGGFSSFVRIILKWVKCCSLVLSVRLMTLLLGPQFSVLLSLQIKLHFYWFLS